MSDENVLALGLIADQIQQHIQWRESNVRRVPSLAEFRSWKDCIQRALSAHGLPTVAWMHKRDFDEHMKAVAQCNEEFPVSAKLRFVLTGKILDDDVALSLPAAHGLPVVDEVREEFAGLLRELRSGPLMVSAESVANAIESALATAQPAEAVEGGNDGMRDAYEGAREDLLDWKGRAQRAEARLRSLGWVGIDASEPPTNDAAQGAVEPFAWVCEGELIMDRAEAEEAIDTGAEVTAVYTHPTPDTTAAELLGLAERIERRVDEIDRMPVGTYRSLRASIKRLRALAGKIKESGT